jgi:micrococcal nuclease
MPLRSPSCLLVLPLCAACLGAPGGDTGGKADSGDTTGGTTDTDTVDSGDQAADDARVRALTGLPEGDEPCAAPLLVRVDYTVDGDTFWATPDGGGDQVKVRFIGVNSPEIAHGDTPADCYGDEAWSWSAARLEGNLVWLTYDAECEDRYGRTLAYVFRDATDAGFFNRTMARNGIADELTIPPDDTYANDIRSDVEAAEREGLGLWGACAR